MSTENLSPEEQEVNRLINESKEKIAAMEQQINNLPRDQGPAPRYNLPGGPQPHDPGKNAELKQELQSAIYKEKDGLAANVDKTLSDAPAAIKEKGQRNLSDFLYGKDKQQEKSAEKQINPSQEFAMKLRYSREQTHKIPDHERAQRKDLDASQDFAQKLRFKAKEDRSASMAKKEDGQPAKNGQDGKSSMSTQFSQKLGFTKWEDGTTGSGSTGKKKEDIEPDKK